MLSMNGIRYGGIFLLSIFFIYGCGKNDAATRAFFDEKISCPSPAIDEFNSWGQSGSEHICKIKHGPFVAFEGGYVRVRGQYDQGKEAGIWRWYSADGRVEKEIDYSKKP